MSTSDTTTEHTTAEQLLLPTGETDRHQEFIDRLNEIDDAVHAGHPMSSAMQCGFMGCGLAVYLTVVIISGFGKRVLCPIHALALIDREVSRE